VVVNNVSRRLRRDRVRLRHSVLSTRSPWTFPEEMDRLAEGFAIAARRHTHRSDALAVPDCLKNKFNPFRFVHHNLPRRLAYFFFVLFSSFAILSFRLAFSILCLPSALSSRGVLFFEPSGRVMVSPSVSENDIFMILLVTHQSNVWIEACRQPVR